MGEYAEAQINHDYKRITGFPEDDDTLIKSILNRPPKNKCPVCGKRLKNPTGMRMHMKGKHGRS